MMNCLCCGSKVELVDFTREDPDGNGPRMIYECTNTKLDEEGTPVCTLPTNYTKREFVRDN